MARPLVALVALVALVGSAAAALQERTFLSPPITLEPGQVANTGAKNTPLDWFEGPGAVRYFSADVVDATNQSVPLSEIYVHHWLVYKNYDGTKGDNGGPCQKKLGGTSQTFGIGAELRGTEYSLPAPRHAARNARSIAAGRPGADGARTLYGTPGRRRGVATTLYKTPLYAATLGSRRYAVVVDGTESWSANLHFLRTDEISDPKILQKCIECHCDDGTPADPHGSIHCGHCDNRGYCWNQTAPAVSRPKTYFRRADLPKTGRGAAAAATWRFR